MSAAGKRRFAVAADSGTRPSADETVGVSTSGRQDVPAASVRQGPAKERIAFTWRLTPAEANTIDGMVLDLKRQLGRARLDRAEMLAALVGLAASNPAVFGALVAQLQAGQAS